MSYPLHRPQQPFGTPVGIVNAETSAIGPGLAVGIDGKLCTDPLLFAGVNMLERDSGKELSIARVGSLVLVKAGTGGLAAKDPLTLDTGGVFIKATEGVTADRDIVGVAFEAASEGAYGLALIK